MREAFLIFSGWADFPPFFYSLLLKKEEGILILCKLSDKCPFYQDQLVVKFIESEKLKAKYCKDDFKSCAYFNLHQRYAAQKREMPKNLNLLPNQMQKAYQILSSDAR